MAAQAGFISCSRPQRCHNPAGEQRLEPGEVRAQLANHGKLLHALDKQVHVPILFEVADRLLEALLGQDVQGKVRGQLGNVNRLDPGESALDYGQKIADSVLDALLKVGEIPPRVLQACQSRMSK